MNTKKFILSSLIAGLFMHSASTRAEDIDIYSGNASSGVPNVLFIMDSAANFSASASNCTYSAAAGGGAPTLNGTAGGIEQCVLVNAIASLPDSGTVNIGIMGYNAANFTSGAATGVGPCVGSDGGCLLKPLTLMNAANKAAMISFVKTWKNSGATNTTSFNIMTNSESTGSAMQEAWAYYNGMIGMSGKNYATPITSAGCQKNFVIFVGNAFTVSGTPGDPIPGPENSTTGLQSAQAGASTAQKTKLSNTIKFPSTTCGVTSLAAGTSASNWSENWADEWARFMYENDTSATRQGAQNITTYSIGVIDNSSCKPDYPALLTNMATYGGGKYFQTVNAGDAHNAILSILNEIQTVNSVFASSSLPVSVSAQGTYLNQIYMGMFRPEETANPRWLGNLKQYSFILDSNGNLKLGDAVGKEALSSSGKGFLSPDAISYWTCSHANNPYLTTLTTAQSALLPSCPNSDVDGGFWKNFPTMASSAGGAYDLSDGELVEKGGAAQQVRQAYRDITATTYSTSGGTRNVYTYCPTGSSCVGNLTDSRNSFKHTNTDITASMFGASTRYKVASIVRSGTTAVVTTLGNHGYSSGATVTIENASDQAYNVTQAVTVTGDTTFTISGLPDYPTTPSAGAYTIATHSAFAITVNSITRTSSSTATGTNSETATATTSSVHGYTAGTQVVIAGASPSDFSGTVTVVNPATSTFDFAIPIYPTATSANTYSVAYHPGTAIGITSITAGNTPIVTTSANHGLVAGQTVTISGAASNKHNGTHTILSSPAPTATTFSFTTARSPAAFSGIGATVVGLAGTAVTISAGNLTRTGTGVTATATATGIAANKFANGALVDIAKTAGTSTKETAYAGTFNIVCSGTCTSFTYTIPVNPATLSASGSINVAVPGATVSVPAGNITRSGTTATVTGIPGGTFTNGQFVDIGISGAAYPDESAYTAAPATGWPITCAGTCTSFTFGPVTLSPSTPAVGAQILAYSASTPPDKTTLINWVRGHDNFGTESGPGGTVTVRPSLHGDVLHSRPAVLNYGGTTGIVVFYGDNGGVFRAINGNQVNPTGSTLPAPPGNELWGFVPNELFAKLSRQRLNDPDLLLPTTIAGIQPPPQKKDYFIDGSTGVYQLVDSNGVTQQAIIYLTMRRGGNFMYAIDVTDPAVPTVLWKIDTSATGMGELGQTWSGPKVARVKGRTNPVLIMAAGYDAAQDSEPPTLADSMGRGVYILDAITGDLVWSATYGSATGTNCASTGTISLTSGLRACTVDTMKFSIPSEVTLVDKDRDSYIDRLYVGDLGGNVWRADLEPSTSSQLADTWQIRRLASLGCFNAECSFPAATSPRKIFYPPEMISTSTYDAVFVITGDREHPLDKDTGSQRVNRMFMLQDQHIGNDVTASPTQTLIRPSDLYDGTDCTASTPISPCTTQVTPKVAYTGQSPGYYITLSNGEKGVNAPLVVAGSVYFGTNVPKAVNTALCTSNLGEARGYRLYPDSAAYGYIVFESEGLPPSPVAGVVSVAAPITNADGTISLTYQNVPFAIGIGSNHMIPGTSTPLDGAAIPCTGADCKSAFGGQKPPITVSTKRSRTYRYIKNK